MLREAVETPDNASPYWKQSSPLCHKASISIGWHVYGIYGRSSMLRTYEPVRIGISGRRSHLRQAHQTWESQGISSKPYRT